MKLKSNPTLKSSKIRVGLSMGDPAGIGPALTLKAFKLLNKKVDLIVIGDSFVLDKAAKSLKIKSLPATKLIDLENVDRKSFKFGKLDAEGGRASLQYLNKAIQLLKQNKIDCLVTCPVSKEAINLTGIHFLGHTEYLAEKTNAKDLLMMLINDKLKFSLVTRHIALKEVCERFDSKNLKINILNTVKCLNTYFLIKKPKIVVCAVNPHASDNGLMGNEELDIIIPVIKNLKNKLKNATVTGPLSADIAISLAAKGYFDSVIVAYHDQALIPLKLTDFNSGVNLTFGLPFVRTSPLHGTAFDIASKPTIANPSSLIAAIKLAVKLTKNAH